MRKFADVTYPLLVATQADYSLFYATGAVIFRFEFIDPKSRVISADLFRFTWLYKNRDRAYLSDRLGFVASKKSVERVVIDGRMSIVYPRKDRERIGLLDLYAFGVKAGLRDRPPVKDALSFRVSFPRVSGVYAKSVLKVRASYKQRSSVGASDYFKLGLGSTWRDIPVSYDRAKMACSVRLVDRVSPSEYLKVKGERQREDDGVGSVDVFDFRLTTRQFHHTVAVDFFFIKNPHSRSFLLGDTSPENTALGGQGYA